MKPAAVARRITAGILIAAVLMAGGWLLRSGSSEEATSTSRQKKVMRPSAKLLTSVRRTTMTEKSAPSGRYRANLLIRVMIPSLQTAPSPDGRAIGLKSPEVLQAAATERKLATRWSIDDAAVLAKLRDMVEVTAAEESGEMATLRVTSSVRDEASEIADALVAAFKARLESAVSERSNRLMEPVQAQIKLRMEAVERTRNEMLEYMNNRAVVDYDFLDRLNGKPGVIQPELDASLSPDIKLAWFSHQLESLRALPVESAIDFLAAAVLPFEHPVTKQCQTWRELASASVAVEGNGDSEKLNPESLKKPVAGAVEDYTDKLLAWLALAGQELPPETGGNQFASTTDHVRQKEYRKLKTRFEAEAEQLKTIQEHAALLFGNDAPIYVPPVVVLKRSVERVRD